MTWEFYNPVGSEELKGQTRDLNQRFYGNTDDSSGLWSSAEINGLQPFPIFCLVEQETSSISLTRACRRKVGKNKAMANLIQALISWHCV